MLDPLSLELADPPYTKPTVTGKPFLDDRNRTFPGNAGNATDVLDVQCWSDAAVSLHTKCSCLLPRAHELHLLAPWGILLFLKE